MNVDIADDLGADDFAAAVAAAVGVARPAGIPVSEDGSGAPRRR
jgi:hypothetical protein